MEKNALDAYDEEDVCFSFRAALSSRTATSRTTVEKRGSSTGDLSEDTSVKSKPKKARRSTHVLKDDEIGKRVQHSL